MTCPLCNDTGYKDHASMLCLDPCGHGVGDVRQVAGKLTKGAAKACIAMTAEWQFPGNATFTANGAHALQWHRNIGGTGILAEYAQMRDGPRRYRTAYRLTPLGLAVRAHLKESENG